MYAEDEIKDTHMGNNTASGPVSGRAQAREREGERDRDRERKL